MVGLKQVSFTVITTLSLFRSVTATSAPSATLALEERSHGQTQGVIGKHGGKALDPLTLSFQRSVGIPARAAQTKLFETRLPKKRGPKTRQGHKGSNGGAKPGPKTNKGGSNGGAKPNPEAGNGGSTGGSALDNGLKTLEGLNNGIGAIESLTGIYNNIQGRSQPPTKRGVEARRKGKARRALRQHVGKAFDLTTGTIAAFGAGYDSYTPFKGQPTKKRAVRDIERRAFEEYIVERYCS